MHWSRRSNVSSGSRVECLTVVLWRPDNHVRSLMALSQFLLGTLIAAHLMAVEAVSMLGGATVATEADVVQDPLRAVSADLTPGESVLRIVRDYNNDALADMALASSASCGNKACSFTLFLKLASGGYVRAGEIGGLPWGYRIVGEKRGEAKWETCSASGEQVTFYSLRISKTAITGGQSRTLHGDEADRVCKWADKFIWQECDMARYVKTGACKWVSKTWP